MKRIIACIFAVSVISAAAFSKNFFSQRFFEVKTGVDFDFSNNLFAGNDFMKRNLNINLRKIADDCPDNGFNIRADGQALFAINLNIKDIHVGFSSGLELYESMNIGQDLFNLLGYGNSIDETLDFSFKNDTDVFAFSQVDLGLKIGKLKISAQPAIFLPVISINGGGGTISVLNDKDGNLKISMNTDMNVYSLVDLKSTDDGVTFDEEKVESTIFTGYGLDLGAGLGYQFTDSFSLDASCRIPLIPGRLNHKATINGGFDYNVKLTDFEQSEKKERETTVTNEETLFFVNRPLKLNVYANKDLLGRLFNARAGAGFGIRRPFCEGAVFYPEYYLGLTLNLIDIFKIGVSTQYKDQLFIHQLGTTVNVRVFQLDFGISTQSSSFKKSLAVAGVGAYAYVTFGF